MSGNCPVHGIPDCSPLLNGCSRLTAPPPTTPRDELAHSYERLIERTDEIKGTPIKLGGVTYWLHTTEQVIEWLSAQRDFVGHQRIDLEGQL